jgi:hypothetical protein
VHSILPLVLHHSFNAFFGNWRLGLIVVCKLWLLRNFAVKSDHGFAKNMVLSGFMKTWFDRQQGSDTDLFFIEKSPSLWHNGVRQMTGLEPVI